MDARAALPLPNKGVEVKLKNANGERKSKNILMEAGNHRRALGDIGNIVARPANRSFNVQIQDDNAAKNKKPAAANANPKKKATAPARTETVVAESPKKEEFATARRSSIKRSSNRKPGRSLTAILSERSKAVCGEDLEKNIDAADADNECAVVEYVDDIYKFYKETEGSTRIRDYMNEQKEINCRMRSILVDWLIEVHNKFELMAESLYLTINIVDRYLSCQIVKRSELQLVGIGAMLVACKYEEIWAPHVDDFVCISDRAYKKEEVLAMERSILRKLEWYLTVPTCYVFLLRFIKVSSSSSSSETMVPDLKMVTENTAWFLAELGLTNYQAAVLCRPSLMAAAAVYAAGCAVEKKQSWSRGMKLHTGYSEEQVLECGKMLVGLQQRASGETKLKAVQRKYLKGERGRVALLNPAKGLLPCDASSVVTRDPKEQRQL